MPDPPSRIRASAGVTVSATAMAAASARTYASASGWENAPVRPPMKNAGSAAVTSTSVAYSIDDADLERRLQDHRGGGPVTPGLAMLAQPPAYVFHVDDGIVDHGGDGYDEPGQDEDVEGGAPQVQHQRGRQQRQRDGDDS